MNHYDGGQPITSAVSRESISVRLSTLRYLPILFMAASVLGTEPTLKNAHGEAQTSPAAQPLDLISNVADANGFPLNPDWRFKSEGPKSPWWVNLAASIKSNCSVVSDRFHGCTSQEVSLDGIDKHPRQLCAGMPITGKADLQHLDWGAVTYSGTIKWQDWQRPIIGYNGKNRATLDFDDDYDFLLTPPDSNGYLLPNTDGKRVSLCAREGPGIGVEVEGQLIARQLRSDWWVDFPTWVGIDLGCQYDGECCIAVNGALTDAHNNPRLAVVTGVASLDCVHDCRFESHPVFAMAIRTEEILANKALARERWSFVARNWAESGGKCSSTIHHLPRIGPTSPNKDGTQKFAILLPWNPRLAAGSSVILGPKTHVRTNSAKIKASGIIVDVQPGRSVSIELSLPDAGDRALIDGDIYLCWNILPSCGKPQMPREESTPEQGVDTLNVGVQLVASARAAAGAGTYPPVPER